MKVINGSTSPLHTVLQSQLQKYTVKKNGFFYNPKLLWLHIRINLIHPITHDNRLKVLVEMLVIALHYHLTFLLQEPFLLYCRFFSNKEPVVQNLISSRCIVYVEFTTRSLCVAFCLYLRKLNENSSTQHIKLECKHKSRDRNEIMQCNNCTRGDKPVGVSCCGRSGYRVLLWS
jgi:hypothetical protein